MPSKLKYFSTLTDQTAADVSANRGSWTGFLGTAAKLYKYTFPEQLLIHAQRQDAIACAPLEMWNEKFNRWVSRGSKGIGLIDETGSYAKVRYVFDVADTVTSSYYPSRPVYLWEMRQEHKTPVLDALAKIYEDVDEDSLMDSFRSIAKQMAQEYYSDNAREIRFNAENSFLEEFDELNLSAAFEEALSTSIAYTIAARCGLDPSDYFEDDDFNFIHQFNTQDMVFALGTASSELSQQVLRDVEIAVNKYERQKAAEKIMEHERSSANERENNLHPSRRLPSAGFDTVRAAAGSGAAAGQVREDEESVPQRPPDNNLQLNAAERNPVPTSPGDRGSGGIADGTGDADSDRAPATARQGDRPDGLGGTDEHAALTSGGNGAERVGVRLLDGADTESFEPSSQLSSQPSEEIPETPSVSEAETSEAEGVSIPGETNSQLGTRPDVQASDSVPIQAHTQNQSQNQSQLPTLGQIPLPDASAGLSAVLSTSSVTIDEVDAILRDGSNDNSSTLRMTAHFAKGLSHEDNIAFLCREYLAGRHGRYEKLGGKGYQFGAEQTSLWFDESGLTIGRGKSALYAKDFAVISWEQAAERVGQLYSTGHYVNHDILDEALYNESRERADDVIEIYRDISRGLSDIRDDLRKAMDKDQREATKNDWKDRRYFIRGLSELNDRVDEAINGENKATPEEIMALYNETISLSEEIPPEWDYGAAHNETRERVTQLLRDKGEITDVETSRGVGYSEISEFGLILRRLREDIGALANEPNAPVRFYRNPRHVLQNLEKAGLPTNGFPAVKISSPNFMRFITDDEINNYFTSRGAHSKGKLGIIAHFLQDHTPKERVDFLKDHYGNSGGTWLDDGWFNNEPGKGVKLQRAGCEDVIINWDKASKLVAGLIDSGRYMSRDELDRIPGYENLILARRISSFYRNLPEDYVSPFGKELDFQYPKEEERAALAEFLSNSAEIDAVLDEMRYAFENTPEEDRYYDTQKIGYESLLAYRDGTYTLFPGIEKIPAPETVNLRSAQPTEPTRPSQSPAATTPSKPSPQLTMFESLGSFPILSSPQEQQTRIEQANEPQARIAQQEPQAQIVQQQAQPTAVEASAAVSSPITQDEIDTMLLLVSDTDRQRLAGQLAHSPRSRETVALVREIYGGIEESLPRSNNPNEYLYALGESSGVIFLRDMPLLDPNTEKISKSERIIGETVTMPWTAIVKRVAELAEIGRFAAAVQEQPTIEAQSTIEGQVAIEEQSTGQAAMEVKNEPELDIQQMSDKSSQIKAVSKMFGLNESLLSELVELQANMRTINEFGRFDRLMDSVDDSKARAYFEKLEGNVISDFRRNIRTYDLLKNFVLTGDFGVTDVKPEAPQIHGADVEPVEPDFDTIAHTVLERVMQDAEFAATLSEAPGRGALRRPLNTALEIAVYEHQEDEPQIFHAYHNDDDFNDRLVDFVYRQAWESKTAREVVQEPHSTPEEPPAPSVDAADTNRSALLSDGVYYRDKLYHVDSIDDSGVVLTDPSVAVPVKMHLFRREFDEILTRDARNLHLLSIEQVTPWLEFYDSVEPMGTVKVNEDKLRTKVDAEPLSLQDTPKSLAVNYRITDMTLGEGGAKTKFRYNIEAVRLLHGLEFDKRSATPEEQEVLSRYVGWGGLPQAFDLHNEKWHNEYIELETTLSPDEYNSAKASTLNAHYTSPTVVKAIYDTVERMGFRTGNILEPSCGVGNFFGMLPDSMRGSKLYGMELDNVSARIAKQLYPKANIQHTGFEKTQMPDSFFDLAIGNIPFGGYGVADKRYDKHKFHIHDYFIAKTLDQVRPGGVIAFVTSKGTLDKANPDMRKYIAQKAELLGAVRLPRDAFLKNAGTQAMPKK